MEFTPQGAQAALESPKETKQKVRFRLILAIPMLTTLLVMGLGYVIIDLQQRQLVAAQPARMNALELYARITHSLDVITVVVIVAAVIAFGSGVALALTVTNPIRKLAQDTASIARGDLSRSISLSADGELAMLGTALNDMVASINQYMLQSMTGGLITINEKEQIIAMSGDAEFILGVSADRAVGSDITSIFPDSPENKPFLDVIREALTRRHTTARQNITVSTEERTNVPISVATSLLRDRENTLVGVSIAFEDVKQLRRVEEHIRKVDRLTTLGGLAASVAHQIRNPLCSIRGLSQLIKENRDDDPTLTNYADVILKDAERIDNVVGRLLNMLQPSNTDWTQEDVNEVLAETVGLSKHEVRDKDITIIEEYGEDLPHTSMQRENLIHAFMNLVINAFQAIPQSGSIHVRSQAMASWDRPRDNADQITTGILVEIQDDGPGMDKATLDKIFNPNFTTKENGSGFGLTIARQTFEAHGGEVFVKSAPGKGTLFRVWLPLRRAQTQEGESLEPVGST